MHTSFLPGQKKTQTVTLRSARLQNLSFHQGGQQKSKCRLALAAAESQADCPSVPGEWCYDGTLSTNIEIISQYSLEYDPTPQARCT